MMKGPKLRGSLLRRSRNRNGISRTIPDKAQTISKAEVNSYRNGLLVMFGRYVFVELQI